MLNLNSDKLIVVVKPDYAPVVITGYTPTILIGSGNTTVTLIGNTWIIFSSGGTSGNYVPLSAFTFYSGTTAPSLYLAISGLTGYWTSAQTVSWVNSQISGITSAWSGLTGIPTENSDLVSLLLAYSLTGHTHTSLYAPLGSYQSHTGNTGIHFTLPITKANVTGLVTDLANITQNTTNLSMIQATTIYFMDDTSNPIVGGYKSLLISPLITTTTGVTKTVNLNNNTQLFEVFSTIIGEPYLSEIPAGMWVFHTHAQFTTITGLNYIHWDMYTRNIVTSAETFLFRTTCIDISTTSLQEYQVSTTQPAYTLGLNDVLICKIYAQTTGGAKTATMTYSKTYNFAFVQPPVILVNSPIDWSIIENVPSDITNITTLLAGKSATGHTHNYQSTGTTLLLNQTTHQHVTGGQPSFDEGIQFGILPTITGQTQGRMYYSNIYKTLMVDASTNMTIPIGEKEIRWVYNNTGAILTKGKIVYDSGNHVGTPNTITVALAKADSVLTSDVKGIISEDIPIASYGFITTGGIINNLDTLSGIYTGMTAGDTLYLSASVAGDVTNVIPTQPNFSVKVGILSFKDSTIGTIYVDAVLLPLLKNLADTYINPTIATDDILKWNGYNWVNSPATLASASAGVNFYLDSVSILSGGTQNDNSVLTFSKTPINTTEVVEIIPTNANTLLSKTFLYNTAIGRTVINAGVWQFNSFVGVDGAGGISTITYRINKVVTPAGTVTLTGTGTTRTVNASTGTPFSTANIDVGGTILTDSYLQTPKGLYRMLTRVSDTQITISVPSTYTNESTVAYSIHKKLFTVTSTEIDNQAISPLYAGLNLLQTTTVQPAFTIDLVDKISEMVIGTASAHHDIYYSHNGANRYSYVTSPLITLHNNLAGLNAGDYVHMTAAQAVIMGNTSNTNTGDETKASIESKLTGNITTHSHSIYALTGHTHSIYLTGATNMGGTTLLHSTPVASQKLQLKGLAVGGTGLSIVTGATTNTISGSTTDIFTTVTDLFLLRRNGTAITGYSINNFATQAHLHTGVYSPTGHTHTTYVLTSAINTYTGTTAPNQFLGKTAFSTYSGTTVPATYYNKTQINAYTGATQTAINLKANSASPTFTGDATIPNIVGVGLIRGNALEIPNLIKKAASANVRNSHDAETSTAATGYTKLKTITLTNGLVGALRILFDVKTNSAGHAAFGKTYHNGVSFGTFQVEATGSYTTKSEDFTHTFNPADTIELWAYQQDAGYLAYVRNFRLAYDDLPTVAVASANS